MTKPLDTPGPRPKNLDQISELRSPRAQAEALRVYMEHGDAKLAAARRMRRRAIVGMRSAGLTWTQIVTETGLSDSAARKGYTRGLAELDAEADGQPLASASSSR